MSYDTETRALTIKNVREEDASDYYCQVVPSEQQLTAYLQVLPVTSARIYDGLNRDMTGRSITYSEGDPIDFYCRGEPKSAQFKWFVGRERAQSNDNLEVKGGNLTIKRATRNDALLYQCLLDGSSDRSTGHASVTVNIRCKNPTAAFASLLFSILFLLMQICRESGRSEPS